MTASGVVELQWSLAWNMTATRSSFSNKTHVLSSDKITVIELTLRLYPLFFHYFSDFACEESESQGLFLQNVAF